MLYEIPQPYGIPQPLFSDEDIQEMSEIILDLATGPVAFIDPRFLNAGSALPITNTAAQLDICSPPKLECPPAIDLETSTDPAPQPVQLPTCRYACPFEDCFVTTSRYHDCRRHLLTHQPKTHMCPDCQKVFLRKDGIAWHKTHNRCAAERTTIRGARKQSKSVKGKKPRARRGKVKTSARKGSRKPNAA